MSLKKVRAQNIEVIEKNQPELFNSIKNNLPTLTDKEWGIVAGLCIEFVIASGGDPDVFVIGEDVKDKDEMLAWNVEEND